MGKAKYLEDAALVIDGRVATLELELEHDVANGEPWVASDRAAIQEAKHLARLIRSLKQSPYRNPYEAARDHFNHGRACDNMNRATPQDKETGR